MAQESFEMISDEWETLNTEFKELEQINKTYIEKLDELGDYQKQCIKAIEHQKYRLNIMSKALKGHSKREKNERVTGLIESIMKRKAQIHGIEDILPKKNGVYLRIILGNVNVSILNKEEKFKYKDEYEKFKLVLSIIGFAMAILNLLLQFRPLELSYMFLLVWYYCTLTIRESILKVNGSRIKGWWRLHHFISTVAAGIFLIWPDTVAWKMFKTQFMWFNSYITVVQYLQFRYQRGALYRLKALGERHNMDITIEGFHSWMWRGLSFLLPFLFFGYLFQLYNAYNLYLLSFHTSATWHVPVLSLMFFILFIGNTVTTIIVIPNKVQEKIKLRYRFNNKLSGVSTDTNEDMDTDKTE